MVLFSNEKYTEGGTICQWKVYERAIFCAKNIKGKGSHLGTEPPCIKFFYYPPPPPGAKCNLETRERFVFFVLILVYDFGFLVF